MATVVQTTSTQYGGYPPQQQQGYPSQQAQPLPPTTVTTRGGGGGNPSVNERYNKQAGLVTGILQIIAGGLLVLFGVIAIALGSYFRLAWSIWGSICFYVVTGILGIVSRNQNRCVIIAYMVMSILSAISAGSDMIYEAAAANAMRWYWGWFICEWENHCGRLSAIVAMHSIASLTALAEMIISIVASCYCCQGCCGSTPTQMTVVTHAAYPAPAPQVTVVSAGGAAYPQPAAYPGHAQPVGAYPPGTSYPQPPPNAPPPNYSQQPQAFEQPKTN